MQAAGSRSKAKASKLEYLVARRSNSGAAQGAGAVCRLRVRARVRLCTRGGPQLAAASSPALLALLSALVHSRGVHSRC